MRDIVAPPIDSRNTICENMLPHIKTDLLRRIEIVSLTLATKKVDKTGLYADVERTLKRRLKRLAELHDRKIGAELSIALRRYLDAEERKAGLSPLPPEEEGEK